METAHEKPIKSGRDVKHHIEGVLDFWKSLPNIDELTRQIAMHILRRSDITLNERELSRAIPQTLPFDKAEVADKYLIAVTRQVARAKFSDVFDFDAFESLTSQAFGTIFDLNGGQALQEYLKSFFNNAPADNIKGCPYDLAGTIATGIAQTVSIVPSDPNFASRALATKLRETFLSTVCENLPFYDSYTPVIPADSAWIPADVNLSRSTI